ncbi:sensor histidine kinase [Actinophytocola oryzae]|uniref:sensor histidine kinase n=1 Tax=Actinophytocola oryzae TaxID=502181 RepID=UPI001AAE5708|nr:histidine kinase [Actinophytocola oryzae]
MESPLVESAEADDQLRYQLGSVLDDVESYTSAALTGEFRTARLTEEIGVTRAMHGIHPSESIRAAIEMFGVLLPEVIRELRAGGGDDAATLAAAVTLNAAIMRRVGLGSVSYASFLLKRVNNSHRDERNRIARELHDRAAHSIGVAIQDLELHDIYRDEDPEHAREKIVQAAALMRDALAAVRETAQELRFSTESHGGLREAVAEYMHVHVPDAIEAGVTVTGDLGRLPSEVTEEMFIVLREAVRNGVRHATPRSIRVTIEMHDGKAVAKVQDDGVGFDMTRTRPGIGLLSMSERIKLLGGDLLVSSIEGAGTTVTITVPVTEVQ